MQLVVLGVVGVGTSRVAALLRAAGAHAVGNADAESAGQAPPPHAIERRERHTIAEACGALLHSADFDWWRLSGFSLSALPDDAVARYLGEMRSIVGELDRSRPWVIDEPLLTLLFPLVRPLLDAPVCIHVTDDPLSVARTLGSRHQLPMTAGLALWELHTVHGFRASADVPRLHVRSADFGSAPVESTMQLLGDLKNLGAKTLQAPSAEAIDAAVRSRSPAEPATPGPRGAWLTGAQQRLAASIDDGSILHRSDILDNLSEGATATLRALEEDRSCRTRLEDLELQRRKVLGLTDAGPSRVDALQQDLDTLDAEVAGLRRDVADEERRVKRLTGEMPAVLQRLETAEQRLRSIERSRSWQLAAATMSARRWVAGSLGGRSNPIAGVRGAIRQARSELEPLLADRTPQTPAGPRDDVAVTRASGTRPRPKVAVLAWDVGHNPLGRAHALAGALERRFDVEIWGAQFRRYGTSVWAPLAGSRIPIRVFEGHSFPDHLTAMRDAAQQIDADAIYVSKPRLPSYGLGVLAKQFRNRPLVLDVDDHELSFFDADDGIELHDLLARSDTSELELPFDRAWTRACEPLVDAADGLTVSNPALQQRYGGGLVVPHARDERVFDPDLYDRDETRRRLGIDPATRLLLFGGTPRAHKGVLELVRALDALGDDRYRLLLFGTRELNTLRGEIGDLDRWLLPLPYQPFSDVPRIVGAADLACVLQDPNHPITRYQMPAKITDALAMRVPCLVRPVAPLQPLIDAEVLQVLEDGEDLAERIARVFDDPDAIDRARRGRKVFEEEYSYDAVAAEVGELFERLLDSEPPPVPARLAALSDAQEHLFGHEERPPVRVPGQRRRPIPDGDQYDVVVFWKQNDTGIYGRRQDMFVKYLERSGAVRSIVHFDAPTTLEDLYREYRRSHGPTDQRRLVVRQTVARIVRSRDTERTRHRTFLHAGNRTSRLPLPPRSAYVDHVKRTLARHGFGDRPTILWAYPTNDDLPGLIDALDPDLVVADVVDDHRTFTRRGTARYESFERNYREVLARSDVVIANCAPVADAMRPLAGEVHVVPNGLELRTGDPRPPRPRELAGIEGPIIGYAGNLSQRVDLPLVEALVRSRPHWQFVFVGSTHHDRSALALASRPNVHFVGVKPYEETRAFIEHFDVAIVPHLDNEMTRSMNPLKAFVYCSTGVPVVSAPVANIGELDDLIDIARGPEEFLAAIERALGRGRQGPDVERLAPHTWERRVEQVLDLVHGAIGAGRAR